MFRLISIIPPNAANKKIFAHMHIGLDIGARVDRLNQPLPTRLIRAQSASTNGLHIALEEDHEREKCEILHKVEART